jgi:hypothetical protein
MLEPGNITKGALIELRDAETSRWIPLTVATVERDKVECRTLADEPILTTVSALLKDARLRPRDGSCIDCGDAHDGPCIERVCAECGVEVGLRCSHHPRSAVHVYRRVRYLAEVVEDKPYPTQELSAALRTDLLEQMRALRDAEEPRQGRVLIEAVERSEILAAMENAVRLIDALPGARRR